jgi:myo-inositol-1(or 4)-monophosphatase
MVLGRGMVGQERARQLERLLRRAGACSFSYFGSAQVSHKADGSLLTDADKAAEEVLVEGLTEVFPGYGVRGEEGAHIDGERGTWYVDPLDGTSAFVQLLAHWGPTVCLVENGELVVGAFWMPRLNEFWFAERGHGAFLNGRRLQRREEGRARSDQVLLLPSRFHRVGPLDWPGKARVLGSSAAHLALVAAGGADATIIPRWNLWDVGCGVLLAEETGHLICAVDGQELSVVEQQGLPFMVGASNAVEYLLAEGRLARLRKRVLGNSLGDSP